MNVKIANALFGYFETLYYINQKLIKLCGVDVTNCFETSEYEILDIIQNIPRIIPYCWNYEKKQLEYKKSNGLLEFSDNISYLKSEYDEILSNNYNFLNDIRLIRNKYQHKMHDINHKSSGSGSMNLFDFSFEVNDKVITIYAGSIIKLVKQINILFSHLANDVSKYAYESNKDDYLYYKRITRMDFLDFNKIYDSDILRIVGKSMLIF